jgi:hypothetical protein
MIRPALFRQHEPTGMKPLRAIIAGILLSVLGATGVPAQGVTDGGITFDSATHRAWYVRFWTGSCREVRSLCLSGAPYWGEIMQRLLAHVPADRREQVRARLIVLGQRIGYEWAKDNDIRRIDDGDIQRWSADLKRNIAHPEPAIARLEQKVRGRLGGTGDPRPSYARRP